MDLIKDIWKQADIPVFQKYLEKQKNEEMIVWTSNLVKTDLPVLAIKTPVLRNIASQIYKGDYISFLDLQIWQYHENTIINGALITKIKDFNTMKKYLDIYSNCVDNWASCDMLSFKVKGYEEQYFNLVLEYIKSDKPFVRRIGMLILFKFITNEQYIDKIFDILNRFSNEENYYVNMINAWLLCECFIKQRDKTITYLNNNLLNTFTINKCVQKCRDSYRVSKADKNMLLKFKV